MEKMIMWRIISILLLISFHTYTKAESCESDSLVRVITETLPTCNYEEFIQILEKQKKDFRTDVMPEFYVTHRMADREELEKISKDDKFIYHLVSNWYSQSVDGMERRAQSIARELGLSLKKAKELKQLFAENTRAKVKIISKVGAKDFLINYLSVLWELDKLTLEREIRTREILGEDFEMYFEKFVVRQKDPIWLRKKEGIWDGCDFNRCKDCVVMPRLQTGVKIEQWFMKNIRKPKGIKTVGRVSIAFDIDKDGSTCNIDLIKSACNDPAVWAEALRLANSIPRWEPAWCPVHNHIIRVAMHLPIRIDP